MKEYKPIWILVAFVFIVMCVKCSYYIADVTDKTLAIHNATNIKNNE